MGTVLQKGVWLCHQALYISRSNREERQKKMVTEKKYLMLGLQRLA